MTSLGPSVNSYQTLFPLVGGASGNETTLDLVWTEPDPTLETREKGQGRSAQTTLDHGPRSKAALQALYRTLTKPRFGQSICSTCSIELDGSYFEHYTLCHTPILTLSSLLIVLQGKAMRYSTMPDISCNTLFSFNSIVFTTYCVVSVSCYAILGITLNFELSVAKFLCVCLSVTMLVKASLGYTPR